MGGHDGLVLRMRKCLRFMLLVGLTLLAGCSQLRWPFHQRQPPAPELAHELVLAPDAAAGSGSPVVDVPQYWKRNTLVLDLGAVNGSGSVQVRPRPGGEWPVRLALRVRPGSVGELEVRADQRVVIPVTATGSRPIDLELPPGVYSPKTELLRLHWGPASGVTP